MHDNHLMKTMIEVAIEAAKDAGASILLAANNLSVLHVEQKSPNDFVSDVDRNAEKIISRHIKHSFPEHNILGEEYGSQGDEFSEYMWVVDPLDGTTNFLRSIAHYAVSIAVLKNGEVEHAVVFDPCKNELFTASRGKGAFMNGQRLNVSNASSIEGGLLSTGIPFGAEGLTTIDMFTCSMTALLGKKTSGIRRLGAAALDLAYVAAGRYDGFWEAGLKKWDIAAGVLLVAEAGGFVTDFKGECDYLNSGNVVAATKSVHLDMLPVVKGCYHRIF